MKWCRETDQNRTEIGRHILTFESRFAADELFRTLQEMRTTHNGSFNILKRETPQFWAYDTTSGDASVAIRNAQQADDLLSFNKRFCSTILPNASEFRFWPIIPNPVIGPDWVNGGTFFIRNRRQPDLYWVGRGEDILVHQYERSKIRIQSPQLNDADKVLIRSDRVTLEILPHSMEEAAAGKKYIGKHRKLWRLMVTDEPCEWSFGDLFKNFGVEFKALENSEVGMPVIWQYVTYNTAGTGEEWELC